MAWQPLQYSCLENSMDRGAWQSSGLQRVGKSWAAKRKPRVWVGKTWGFIYRVRGRLSWVSSPLWLCMPYSPRAPITPVSRLMSFLSVSTALPFSFFNDSLWLGLTSRQSHRKGKTKMKHKSLLHSSNISFFCTGLTFQSASLVILVFGFVFYPQFYF